MNKNDSSTITAATVVSLRNEPEALRIITEKLGVKAMGPADHIRTKHEVKAFLETGGDLATAERIVDRAQARRDLQRAHREELTQRQGQRMSQ
jgi:hypothetical protein